MIIVNDGSTTTAKSNYFISKEKIFITLINQANAGPSKSKQWCSHCKDQS
jgi:hypothetical protein